MLVVIIGTISEAMIFAFTVKAMAGIKGMRNIRWWLFALATVVSMFLINIYVAIPHLFKAAVAFLIFTILCRFILRKPLHVAYFYTVMTLYTIIIADVTAGMALSIAIGTNIALLPLDSYSNYWIIFTLILFKIAGAFFAVWLVRQLQRYEHPIRHWLLLDASISMAYIIVGLLAMYIPQPTFPIPMPLCLLLNCCLMGITAVMLLTFARLAQHYTQEKEDAIIRLTAEDIEQQIDRLNQNAQVYKKIRHDLDNHISTVCVLLQNGKTEDAVEYLQAISITTPEINYRTYTKNNAIDSVLNLVAYKAAAANVQIEPVCSEIRELENIGAAEITSLVTNLADNAIAGVQQLPEDQRSIRLMCFTEKGVLIFIAENRFTRPLKVQDGQLISSKDEPGHGLGLEIATEICQRHDGQLEIFYDKNTFKVRAMLID